MNESSGTSERKERHLGICVDPGRFRIETRQGGAGFEGLAFAHRALPELSLAELDSSAEFLGYRLSIPLLVSCMTGGSSGGGRVNHGLARAANEARVAFGLGSFRILLHDPAFLEDFRVRRFLPDVPLLANIGAVVLREAGAVAVLELAKAVEADALVIHLNPGQELLQGGGDRDFRGLKAALAALLEIAKIPIIVKETGFGIGPSEALALLDAGVAWVDLAGAGGSNWIAVEAFRLEPGPLQAAAADFGDWGYRTAPLLAATCRLEASRGAGAIDGGQGTAVKALPLIASGGLRNGVEVAKALALGAGMAAMALPLLRAVERGGEAAARDYLERVAIGLRSTMLLTGSRTVDGLRRGILRPDPAFEAEVAGMLGA